MKAAYKIVFPFMNYQTVMIIAFILVWYFLDNHFLNTGIPLLCIPISKVVFLREKMLNLSLYPRAWNKNVFHPVETDHEGMFKITTEVYTLPFWSCERIKNQSLHDGGVFLSPDQKFQPSFFKSIISQKTFLNASGERVIEQWRWLGGRFPHAIQHSYLILPVYLKGHTTRA